VLYQLTRVKVISKCYQLYVYCNI